MVDLAEVRHAFVLVNDLRLHRVEYGGSGRPIVCLHGVTGHAWVWHDVTAYLRSVGRVVGVDMRGYGESQWAPDGAYTTEHHVADLAGVLDDLGVEQVDLAGNSWGGMCGSRAFASM